MRLVRDEPICPKHQAVQQWVARRLGNVEHEKQVATIATNLFDLTSPLHDLAPADRRLLRLGALVHDVGRCVRDDGHAEEGAWMVMSNPALPLSHSERRALGYLTLYHRGPVPDPGRDAILDRGDDSDRMRMTLALLRAADALNRRSLPAPRVVFTLAQERDEHCLRVSCYLKQDSDKVRRSLGRRKKFRLLEQLLPVRVETEIIHARALRLVA